MTYTIQTPSAGFPKIEESIIGTSGEYIQGPALGTIVRAEHSDYGGGEFIWLLGVTSQVSGNLVTFDPSTAQVTLAPTAEANSGNPVAVAMSATTAAKKYGWYQVLGIAPVLKDAVQISSGGIPIYQGADGRITDVAASGAQIMGAQTANTAAVTTTTSTVLVRLAHPHYQGQLI